MEAKLKVRVGANAGKELKISGPKFFIGRAEDCHLRPKSDLISRHHCVLLIDESMLVVRDLGSRNGTLVNGQLISGERDLSNGDILRIGPLEFEVVIAESIAATKRPKVTSIKEAAARTAEGRPTDDADVTQWLGPEETKPEPTRPVEAETREMESVETEEIQLATTMLNIPAAEQPKSPPSSLPAEAPEANPEAHASASSAPEQTGPTPGKPGGPKGKLPFRPRSADSRQAAADVLRKFFNRR